MPEQLLVPRAGVEPARPFGQRILSPQRLPFRHPGMLSVTATIPRISVSLKQEYLNVENVGAWKMRGYLYQFFTRFSLYRHQRKTLGPAMNSPVKLNSRYGVPSVVCIIFPQIVRW